MEIQIQILKSTSSYEKIGSVWQSLAVSGSVKNQHIAWDNVIQLCMMDKYQVAIVTCKKGENKYLSWHCRNIFGVVCLSGIVEKSNISKSFWVVSKTFGGIWSSIM